MPKKSSCHQDTPFNQSLAQAHDLISVWNVIEILSPSNTQSLMEYCKKLDQMRKSKQDRMKLYGDNEELYRLEDMPHLNPSCQTLDRKAGYEYKIHWQVYIGYLNWTAVEEAIEKKMSLLFDCKDKSQQLRQTQTTPKKTPTLTPMSGFMIDEKGCIRFDSLLISNSAWAFGRIMQTRNKEDLSCLEDFQKQIDIITNELTLDFYKTYSEEEPLSKDAIEFLFTKLVEKLQIDPEFMLVKDNICIKKVKRQRKSTSQNATALNTPPPLDLFTDNYIDDLVFVQGNLKKISPNSAAGKYLGLAKKPNSPNVLENRDVIRELLAPERTAYTRWPSSSSRSLAALQSAAQNAILSPFKMINENRNGQLFAVNGPPGTGKTTLLFDLIVNIYVERAYHLSQLKRPEDGFQSNMKLEVSGFTYNVRDLIPSLTGYEIVIASSNNNAVKNITKELPLKSSIDPLYHHMMRQFPDVLTELPTKPENWSLFAAPLGNSTNISDFKKIFFDTFSKNFQPKNADNPSNHDLPPLPSLYEYLKLIKDAAKSGQDSVTAIQQQWENEVNSFKIVHSSIIKVFSKLKEFMDKDFQIRVVQEKYNPVGLLVLFKQEKETYENILLKIKSEESDLELVELELDCLGLGLFEMFHRFLHTKTYKAYLRETHAFTKKMNHLKKSLVVAKEAQLNHLKNINLMEEDLGKIRAIEAILAPIKEFLCTWEFDLEKIQNNAYWKLDESSLQKTIPFFSPKFEELRTSLFAKALNLHELFVKANAKIFWNGLTLFKAALGNSLQDNTTDENIHEKIQAAWHNFFMITPVVSTTFFSFRKMFQDFDLNEIGWLFIDEAGQASPQHALGAIYRSSNVIVVGDPLQTEPISVLGKSLIDRLFENHNISPKNWSPAFVSTQNLADRNSPYQAIYGEDTVVGFPLLTHRRCEEPMFSICNSLAYDNKMIYAVQEGGSPLRPLLGTSRWIDIVDINATKKVYESEEEISFVFKMIQDLLDAPSVSNENFLESLYIITLYKKYSETLKNRLKIIYENTPHIKQITLFCNNNIGTIHAFQGKENDSVILMLGAQNPADGGARSIMVEKPNVLNVGVSRAKRNIYIIGNRSLWRSYPNMAMIMGKLDDYGNQRPFSPVSSEDAA